MKDLSTIFAGIGIDRDYSDMDFAGLSEDLQGWASDHPIFLQVLKEAKPKVVVEVGTWKGASVIHMAKVARDLNLQTRFICVDTWLGSNDVLWIHDYWRKSLMLKNGFPSMFRQFIYNLKKHEVADDVFPMPMTSSCAYHVLKKLHIRPDAIYIDAGHEENEVMIDLRLYFDLLAPGGWFFGDDYLEAWKGVVKAVNRFSADQGLLLRVQEGKWCVRKPGQPEITIAEHKAAEAPSTQEAVMTQTEMPPAEGAALRSILANDPNERAALETELKRVLFERDAAAAEATRWSEAAMAITDDHNPFKVVRRGWLKKIVERLIGNRQCSPLLLADQAYAAGQWELAARYYRDALDLSPAEPRIWLQCGYALQAAGKIAAAEVAFSKSKAFEHRGAQPRSSGAWAT